MRVLNKILAFFISLICLIALAGCGGNDAINLPASESSSSAPVSASSLAESNAPVEKDISVSQNEIETNDASSGSERSSSLTETSSASETISNPVQESKIAETQNGGEPSSSLKESSVSSDISRNISSAASNPPVAESSEGTRDAVMPTVSIQVGSKSFTVRLYDNASTQALLEKMPLTLNMDELNGNEKYYYLPDSLPTDSQQVGNISNGDLMLYGSDCLVLFYKSFTTSYSYTRLGYIEDASGLAAALGSGSAQVTFSADGQ